MEIFSKTLNKSLDVEVQTINEGGNTLNIITHARLEDIIYNDADCIAKNVQVRFTPAVTETDHYCFFCAISDIGGRRCEGFGESTRATLTTEIARNYPALMAQKRAFDDAAMKYLGITDAYSDQQINVGSSTAAPVQTPAPATVPAAAPKTAPAPAPATRGRKPAAVKQAAPADAAEPAPKKEETTQKTSPAPEPEEEVPGMEAELPAVPDFNTEAVEETSSEEVSAAVEEPESVAKDEAPTASTEAGDKFDVPLTCGVHKKSGETIRQVFAHDPESVRWVAFKMAARTEMAVEMQKLCVEYCEMMDGGAK